MQIKINLKVFLFLLIFLITRQIKIYALLMCLALIHELGHVMAGIILGFKPESISIIPTGFSVKFKNDCKNYNKKIKNGNMLALGEVYFFSSKYLEAISFFSEALKCPEGLGNPLINLRMGQCYYELGNYGSAKGYLLKAYMVEGKEIFEGEDDKYIKFVAQIR